LAFLKQVRIVKIEERAEDAWYDMSLRQLRNGKVCFYRVRDFLTGEWLFKTCRDSELGKLMVKAVKCPVGTRFAQLEGNTMLFQRSQRGGWLYDIVSLAQADENDRVTRKVADMMEEVPTIIRENYEVRPYEEATGKKAPGKHLVTLTKSEDEKAMVTLFLLERAWTLSPITPEDRLKALQQQEKQKPKEKVKDIDTGHTVTCPICGDKFRFKHIEKEKALLHKLMKAEPHSKNIAAGHPVDSSRNVHS
jgi:hypothetical protein